MYMSWFFTYWIHFCADNISSQPGRYNVWPSGSRGSAPISLVSTTASFSLSPSSPKLPFSQLLIPNPTDLNMCLKYLITYCLAAARELSAATDQSKDIIKRIIWNKSFFDFLGSECGLEKDDRKSLETDRWLARSYWCTEQLWWPQGGWVYGQGRDSQPSLETLGEWQVQLCLMNSQVTWTLNIQFSGL